jgi:hypothetical protein
LKPDKIFGLIFFQCKYDKVTMDLNEQIEKEYYRGRSRYFMQLKMKSPELKSMKKLEWDEYLETKLYKEYDSQHKENYVKQMYETLSKGKQLYADLPATIDDAKKMYQFLDRTLVRNLSDITIMCEREEYRRFIEKAKPLWSLFELAADYEDYQNFLTYIQTEWSKVIT